MAEKSIDPRKFLEKLKNNQLSEAEEAQFFQSLFTEKEQIEKNRILELHHAHQRTRQFRLKVLSYSAAAIFLAVIGFWFLRQSPKKPIQNSTEIVAGLSEKHSKTFISRDKVLMSPPKQEDLAWEAAYDAKNFGKAIDVLEKTQLSDTTKFYLGLCYLQNTPSQPQKAIEIWSNQVSKHRRDEIQWWISVAYLRKGDAAQAQKTLSDIKEGAYKYDEAQILLKHIKE